jgi:hypothetical protein
MNKILDTNLNTIAATTTTAIVLTGVEDSDQMLDAFNRFFLSNVAKQFKEKQGVDFKMDVHEIPTEYCAEALQTAIAIAKFAEKTLAGALSR